ncbi:unnamed protein product [Cylindrotheca closterium]|nr:unnamed protein product [Cylindrotheca closterium]
MARATQHTAVTPPPQPTYAPPPPQPVTTASIPPNPMDLSIEEQAALFRQMMMEKQDPHAQEMAQFQKQQQQQERKMKDPYQAATPRVYGPPPDLRHPYSHPDPAVSLPPPAPTRPKDYREYGTGPDGRKVGRNADADSVSNAADVYLAQLKRDSTTRNYARYAGDDQVANQVFHDPSIAEIHAPENPYREAQREKERELYDTVPEEMLIFQEYTKVEEYQAAPRMSYKEKLAQYKDKKEQQQQQQQQGGQQEQ